MENRYAVVDIGSNTVRMVVYDRDANGDISRVIGEKAALGLINFIENDVMTDAGVVKLLETLEGFKVAAEQVGCDTFLAFATASLRRASNRGDVVDQVRERLDVSIDVLSGDEEARLNFEGLSEVFELDTGIMVDMGGGSTEVIRFYDGTITDMASLDFGSLALHNKFVKRVLPTKREITALCGYVRGHVNEHAWIPGKRTVAYAIGGTAKAAAKVYASVMDCKRPSMLTQKQLIKLYRHMMAHRERATITLVEEVPDRLHTFIPGLAGLIEILRIAGAEEVFISTCGLREGYLKRHIAQTKAHNKTRLA